MISYRLEWSVRQQNGWVEQPLGWSGGTSKLPALGAVHQEAPSTPPSAAVLLQKGMQSFRLLHKDGCGHSSLATFEKMTCIAL